MVGWNVSRPRSIVTSTCSPDRSQTDRAIFERPCGSGAPVAEPSTRVRVRSGSALESGGRCTITVTAFCSGTGWTRVSPPAAGSSSTIWRRPGAARSTWAVRRSNYVSWRCLGETSTRSPSPWPMPRRGRPSASTAAVRSPRGDWSETWPSWPTTRGAAVLTAHPERLVGSPRPTQIRLPVELSGMPIGGWAAPRSRDTTTGLSARSSLRSTRSAGECSRSRRRCRPWASGTLSQYASSPGTTAIGRLLPRYPSIPKHARRLSAWRAGTTPAMCPTGSPTHFTSPTARARSITGRALSAGTRRRRRC